MTIISLVKAALIGALTLPLAAFAADPPGRVGRLTHIEGEVSFFSDKTSGWAPATQNYPVTSENSLWTNGPARAEVRIGPSAVRLDDDSVLDFILLDDTRTRALLQRGAIHVRLRALVGERSDGVEIDVANGRITLEGNGHYKIETDESLRESRVTVMAGRARFAGLGRVTVIDAGRAFFVGAGRSQFETMQTNAFDQWAMARDEVWDATHARYANNGTLSPAMTGYEDLDANGDWIEDREYGRLWSPRAVVADWAPYRHGHWAHVNPWGWTWVDDAPWGFAPFHYGRWLTIGSRWFWSPGSYGSRPVYAPALVAWQGYPGGNDGFSASVGWFPLGPREHYVPHYRHNAAYLRDINHVRHHQTVIAAPTRFINHNHGRTHVPHNVFTNAKPVAPHAIRPTADGRNHHGGSVTMVPPARANWRTPHGGSGQQNDRGRRDTGVSGAVSQNPSATFAAPVPATRVAPSLAGETLIAPTFNAPQPPIVSSQPATPMPRGYPRRAGERAMPPVSQDMNSAPIVNSPQPPIRAQTAPVQTMPPPRPIGLPQAPQQPALMPPLVPLNAPVLAPPPQPQRPLRVQPSPAQPMILPPATASAPVMNSPAPPVSAERRHHVKPAPLPKSEGKDGPREHGQPTVNQ